MQQAQRKLRMELKAAEDRLSAAAKWHPDTEHPLLSLRYTQSGLPTGLVDPSKRSTTHAVSSSSKFSQLGAEVDAAAAARRSSRPAAVPSMRPPSTPSKAPQKRSRRASFLAPWRTGGAQQPLIRPSRRLLDADEKAKQRTQRRRSAPQLATHTVRAAADTWLEAAVAIKDFDIAAEADIAAAIDAAAAEAHTSPSPSDKKHKEGSQRPRSLSEVNVPDMSKFGVTGAGLLGTQSFKIGSSSQPRKHGLRPTSDLLALREDGQGSNSHDDSDDDSVEEVLDRAVQEGVFVRPVQQGRVGRRRSAGAVTTTFQVGASVGSSIRLHSPQRDDRARMHAAGAHLATTRRDVSPRVAPTKHIPPPPVGVRRSPKVSQTMKSGPSQRLPPGAGARVLRTDGDRNTPPKELKPTPLSIEDTRSNSGLGVRAASPTTSLQARVPPTNPVVATPPLHPSTDAIQAPLPSSPKPPADVPPPTVPPWWAEDAPSSPTAPPLPPPSPHDDPRGGTVASMSAGRASQKPLPPPSPSPAEARDSGTITGDPPTPPVPQQWQLPEGAHIPYLECVPPVTGISVTLGGHASPVLATRAVPGTGGGRGGVGGSSAAPKGLAPTAGVVTLRWPTALRGADPTPILCQRQAAADDVPVPIHGEDPGASNAMELTSTAHPRAGLRSYSGKGPSPPPGRGITSHSSDVSTKPPLILDTTAAICSLRARIDNKRAHLLTAGSRRTVYHVAAFRTQRKAAEDAISKSGPEEARKRSQHVPPGMPPEFEPLPESSFPPDRLRYYSGRALEVVKRLLPQRSATSQQQYRLRQFPSSKPAARPNTDSAAARTSPVSPGQAIRHKVGSRPMNSPQKSGTQDRIHPSSYSAMHGDTKTTFALPALGASREQPVIPGDVVHHTSSEWRARARLPRHKLLASPMRGGGRRKPTPMRRGASAPALETAKGRGARESYRRPRSPQALRFDFSRRRGGSMDVQSAQCSSSEDSTAVALAAIASREGLRVSSRLFTPASKRRHVRRHQHDTRQSLSPPPASGEHRATGPSSRSSGVSRTPLGHERGKEREPRRATTSGSRPSKVPRVAHTPGGYRPGSAFAVVSASSLGQADANAHWPDRSSYPASASVEEATRVSSPSAKSPSSTRHPVSPASTRYSTALPSPITTTTRHRLRETLRSRKRESESRGGWLGLAHAKEQEADRVALSTTRTGVDDTLAGTVTVWVPTSPPSHIQRNASAHRAPRAPSYDPPSGVPARHNRNRRGLTSPGQRSSGRHGGPSDLHDAHRWAIQGGSPTHVRRLQRVTLRLDMGTHSAEGDEAPRVRVVPAPNVGVSRDSRMYPKARKTAPKPLSTGTSRPSEARLHADSTLCVRTTPLVPKVIGYASTL